MKGISYLIDECYRRKVLYITMADCSQQLVYVCRIDVMRALDKRT